MCCFGKRYQFKNIHFSRVLALKISSMFGPIDICECTFSNMKHIKSKESSRLTDYTLGHLLGDSTIEVEVDFAELSSVFTHPQISHQTSCKIYK